MAKKESGNKTTLNLKSKHSRKSSHQPKRTRQDKKLSLVISDRSEISACGEQSSSVFCRELKSPKLQVANQFIDEITKICNTAKNHRQSSGIKYSKLDPTLYSKYKDNEGKLLDHSKVMATSLTTKRVSEEK